MTPFRSICVLWIWQRHEPAGPFAHFAMLSALFFLRAEPPKHSRLRKIGRLAFHALSAVSLRSLIVPMDE